MIVPGRCGEAMRTLPNPVAALNPDTCTSAVPLPGIASVVEPAAEPLLLNAVTTMPVTVALWLLRISTNPSYPFAGSRKNHGENSVVS